MSKKHWLTSTLTSELGIPRERIFFSKYHLSHAASAYLCSPFDEAAILTVDGVGEWVTATYAVGQGNQITTLKQIEFPHSIGLLYSAFAEFLGFEVNEAEYKVMGMAPYGQPRLGQHDRSEALFYQFRLEDHVPETHLLRLIEKHISCELVRERLKDSQLVDNHSCVIVGVQATLRIPLAQSRISRFLSS